jgi:Secretion system C-terminal sorting domain
MKKNAAFIFIFLGFLNLKAQTENPEPYTYATGKVDFYLDSRNGASQFYFNSTLPEAVKPLKKVTYEYVGGQAVFNSKYVYSYLANDCSKPVSTKGTGNTGIVGHLDSFFFTNGKVTSSVSTSFNSTTGQKEYEIKEIYYYNNNRVKPDSLRLTFDAQTTQVVTFNYDAQNRLIGSNTFRIGNNIRYHEVRIVCNYDANGGLIYYKEEYNNGGVWFVDSEWKISYLSGKIDKNAVSGSLNGNDSLQIKYNFMPNTNKIQSIVFSNFNKTTAKRDTIKRFYNQTQNAKGYPTQILEQTTTNNGANWKTIMEYNYTYHPGDTLYFQRSIRELSNNQLVNTYKASFEYCGVAGLSPTQETEKLDFKLYPNPANHILNLEIPQNTEGVLSVEIFNNLGVLVSKSKDTVVETANWANGFYLVKVKKGAKTGTMRFMIVK